jgi:hypothetical protein
MTEWAYRIVEHDGGWAYKAGDVFSEAYPTHKQAFDAARRAAAEQQTPGHPEVILYEDENGKWHQEAAPGNDRPITLVVDKA